LATLPFAGIPLAKTGAVELLPRPERPLADLALRLERDLLGPDAFAIRLVSLGLHALLASLVYALARRLGLGRGTAFLVGALFGASGCHATSIREVEAQGALLGALLLGIALVLHVEEARTAAGRVASTILAGGALVLSLLAAPAGLFFLPIAAALRRDLPKL